MFSPQALQSFPVDTFLFYNRMSILNTYVYNKPKRLLAFN